MKSYTRDIDAPPLQLFHSPRPCLHFPFSPRATLCVCESMAAKPRFSVEMANAIFTARRPDILAMWLCPQMANCQRWAISQGNLRSQMARFSAVEECMNTTLAGISLSEV